MSDTPIPMQSLTDLNEAQAGKPVKIVAPKIPIVPAPTVAPVQQKQPAIDTTGVVPQISGVQTAIPEAPSALAGVSVDKSGKASAFTSKDTFANLADFMANQPDRFLAANRLEGVHALVSMGYEPEFANANFEQIVSSVTGQKISDQTSATSAILSLWDANYRRNNAVRRFSMGDISPETMSEIDKYDERINLSKQGDVARAFSDMMSTFQDGYGWISAKLAGDPEMERAYGKLLQDSSSNLSNSFGALFDLEAIGDQTTQVVAQMTSATVASPFTVPAITLGASQGAVMGAPGAVETLGLSSLAGATAGAVRGWVAGMAADAAVTERGNFLLGMRQKGIPVTDPMAQLLSVPYAIGAGILEYTEDRFIPGLSGVLGNTYMKAIRDGSRKALADGTLNKVLISAKEIGTSSFVSGATEGMTQVLQNILTNATVFAYQDLNPDPSRPTIPMTDILEGVSQAFTAGFQGAIVPATTGSSIETISTGLAKRKRVGEISALMEQIKADMAKVSDTPASTATAKTETHPTEFFISETSKDGVATSSILKAQESDRAGLGTAETFLKHIDNKFDSKTISENVRRVIQTGDKSISPATQIVLDRLAEQGTIVAWSDITDIIDSIKGTRTLEDALPAAKDLGYRPDGTKVGKVSINPDDTLIISADQAGDLTAVKQMVLDAGKKVAVWNDGQNWSALPVEASSFSHVGGVKDTVVNVANEVASQIPTNWDAPRGDKISTLSKALEKGGMSKEKALAISNMTVTLHELAPSKIGVPESAVRAAEALDTGDFATATRAMTDHFLDVHYSQKSVISKVIEEKYGTDRKRFHDDLIKYIETTDATTPAPKTKIEKVFAKVARFIKEVVNRTRDALTPDAKIFFDDLFAGKYQTGGEIRVQLDQAQTAIDILTAKVGNKISRDQLSDYKTHNAVVTFVAIAQSLGLDPVPIAETVTIDSNDKTGDDWLGRYSMSTAEISLKVKKSGRVADAEVLLHELLHHLNIFVSKSPELRSAFNKALGVKMSDWGVDQLEAFVETSLAYIADGGKITTNYPGTEKAIAGMVGLIKRAMTRARTYGETTLESRYTEIEKVMDGRLRSLDRDVTVLAGFDVNSQDLLAPNGKPSNLTPAQWKQVRTPEFKAWFGDWETDPANASKVVDENGEPLVVYHGTSGDLFDTFSHEAGDLKTGADSARLGFFATNNPIVAKEYSENTGKFGFPGLSSLNFEARYGDHPATKAFRERLSAAKAEIEAANDARDAEAVRIVLDRQKAAGIEAFTKETASASPWLFRSLIPEGSSFAKAIEDANAKYYAIQQESSAFFQNLEIEDLPNKRVMNLFLNIRTPSVFDAEGKTPGEFALTPKIESALKAGNDGVVFKNLIDPVEPSTHYVTFDPTQIKSATANSGAFDPSNPSILYSKADQKVEQDPDPDGELEDILVRIEVDPTLVTDYELAKYSLSGNATINEQIMIRGNNQLMIDNRDLGKATGMAEAQLAVLDEVSNWRPGKIGDKQFSALIGTEEGFQQVYDALTKSGDPITKRLDKALGEGKTFRNARKEIRANINEYKMAYFQALVDTDTSVERSKDSIFNQLLISENNYHDKDRPETFEEHVTGLNDYNKIQSITRLTSALSEMELRLATVKEDRSTMDKALSHITKLQNRALELEGIAAQAKFDKMDAKYQKALMDREDLLNKIDILKAEMKGDKNQIKSLERSAEAMERRNKLAKDRALMKKAKKFLATRSPGEVNTEMGDTIDTISQIIKGAEATMPKDVPGFIQEILTVPVNDWTGKMMADVVAFKEEYLANAKYAFEVEYYQTITLKKEKLQKAIVDQIRSGKTPIKFRTSPEVVQALIDEFRIAGEVTRYQLPLETILEFMGRSVGLEQSVKEAKDANKAILAQVKEDNPGLTKDKVKEIAESKGGWTKFLSIEEAQTEANNAGSDRISGAFKGTLGDRIANDPGAIKNFLQKMAESNIDPVRILMFLDGGEAGAFTAAIWDTVYGGEDGGYQAKYLRDTFKAHDGLMDILKSGGKDLKYFNEPITIEGFYYDRGPLVGKDITVSRSELMEAYAATLSGQKYRALRWGNGWPVGAIREAQRLMESSEFALDKKVVDYIIGSLASRARAMQKTYELVTGTRFSYSEGSYTSIFRTISEADKESSILSANQAVEPGTNKSVTKERKYIPNEGQSDIKLDMIQNFFRATDISAKYTHAEIPLKVARESLGFGQMRRDKVGLEIQDALGDSMTAYLSNLLDRELMAIHTKHSMENTAISKINSNLTVAALGTWTLGFGVNAAFQATALLQAAQYMKNIPGGLVTMVTNFAQIFSIETMNAIQKSLPINALKVKQYNEILKTVEDQSPMLRARAMDINIQQANIDKMTGKTRRLAEMRMAVMYGFLAVDKAAVASVFLAVRDDYLAHNGDRPNAVQEAVNEATRVVALTQPMSDNLATPKVFKDSYGTTMGLMLNFMQGPWKQAQQMGVDIVLASMATLKNGKGGLFLAKTIAFGWGVAVFMNILNFTMKNNQLPEDEEWWKVSIDTILMPLGWVGNLIQSVLNIVLPDDVKTMLGGVSSRPPVLLRTIDSLQRDLKNALQGSSEETRANATLRGLINASGTLGFPSNNTNKIISGVKAGNESDDLLEKIWFPISGLMGQNVPK